MQVLVVLLIGTFVVGGTAVGQRIRERPLVLVALAILAASSYYSLRVVL